MSRLKSNSGITMIELITVIVIVGLLAALATPNILPLVDTIKLRTGANTIKRLMIVARTRALSDPNTHVGVGLIDSTQACVFFDVPAGTQYHRDATDPLYLGTYKLPQGIKTIIPSSGGITDSVVVFRGDGSAKNGGNIQVKSKRGSIKTINVLASTGRVRVN
jgi:prepilin-type N-terminal cleavage/methylation domain-containing protein